MCRSWAQRPKSFNFMYCCTLLVALATHMWSRCQGSLDITIIWPLSTLHAQLCREPCYACSTAEYGYALGQRQIDPKIRFFSFFYSTKKSLNFHSQVLKHNEKKKCHAMMVFLQFYLLLLNKSLISRDSTLKCIKIGTLHP